MGQQHPDRQHEQRRRSRERKEPHKRREGLTAKNAIYHNLEWNRKQQSQRNGEQTQENDGNKLRPTWPALPQDTKQERAVMQRCHCNARNEVIKRNLAEPRSYRNEGNSLVPVRSVTLTEVGLMR